MNIYSEEQILILIFFNIANIMCLISFYSPCLTKKCTETEFYKSEKTIMEHCKLVGPARVIFQITMK